MVSSDGAGGDQRRGRSAAAVIPPGEARAPVIPPGEAPQPSSRPAKREPPSSRPAKRRSRHPGKAEPYPGSSQTAEIFAIPARASLGRDDDALDKSAAPVRAFSSRGAVQLVGETGHLNACHRVAEGLTDPFQEGRFSRASRRRPKKMNNVQEISGMTLISTG